MPYALPLCHVSSRLLITIYSMREGSRKASGAGTPVWITTAEGQWRQTLVTSWHPAAHRSRRTGWSIKWSFAIVDLIATVLALPANSVQTFLLFIQALRASCTLCSGYLPSAFSMAPPTLCCIPGRIAAYLALLLLLSASAHCASVHFPARKLLQSASSPAPAPSNQSTAPGPVEAPPVSTEPAPAASTGDSGPAAAPASADVNMTAPMQGAFPALYQPPQLQDDSGCATDDTLFQLVFTAIGDLLGAIPEVCRGLGLVLRTSRGP
jgi:hypothetical protein